MGVYLVSTSFFFFKQKTAYEMRISDWSSDVCSSDLRDRRRADRPQQGRLPEARLQRQGLGLVRTRDPRPAGPAATGWCDRRDLPEIGRASCRERVCPYV